MLFPIVFGPLRLIFQRDWSLAKVVLAMFFRLSASHFQLSIVKVIGMDEKGRLNEIQCRLLYILHLGCVEARLLALKEKNMQLYELADMLEVLPSYLVDWSEDKKNIIMNMFDRYQRKYPEDPHEYTRFLNEYTLPEDFQKYASKRLEGDGR